MKANTGEVYKSWDGLSNIIRPSRVTIRTGNPAYGVKSYLEVMYKDFNTDYCYYQRPLSGTAFLRINDYSAGNRNSVYKFACSDANSATYDVTNGAASPRNSAFKWGTEAVNLLKRASKTKWDFDLNIRVHHIGIAAHWNGQAVILGDGDPRFFFPLTTPDTVTHEVSHAFTEHNSNLEYRSQSGAINEAYSDMAAAAFLDYFYKYDASKVYRIGGASLKYRTALRDLCNPRNSNLLQYRPDKPILTSALDYTIATDLHNASALYSKAFCELSKSTGWDIEQAFTVFTNANVIYWKPRDTFNSAACGVKKAAYDLKNTYQAVADVDRAFSTVDIACDQPDWINL
ncbi:nprV [Bugula neritina]|uniref:NprV n=1 Tax=Bugula neritina TaxID=10212 RepID=A0A7J7JRH9_BUGNE|nr:nprV [Bugula neritina]